MARRLNPLVYFTLTQQEVKDLDLFFLIATTLFLVLVVLLLAAGGQGQDPLRH